MHMFLVFPQKVVEFGTAIFDPLSGVLDKVDTESLEFVFCPRNACEVQSIRAVPYLSYLTLLIYLFIDSVFLIY